MIRSIATLLLAIVTAGAQAPIIEPQLGPNVSPSDKVLLAPFELPARYLLRGATVHTVSGDTIEDGSVLVVDGVIQEVGTDLDVSVQTDVDLEGFHLYPGLISAASPLGLLEIGAVRATRDYSEVGAYTPDIEAWLAVNPDSELIPVARAGGVAYSLVVPRGGIVAGQSGLIQLDGWGMEEMAFAKPVALHLYWPNARLNTRSKERISDSTKWKSPEDQHKDRLKKIAEITEFIADARAYKKAKATAKKTPDFIETPAWEAMLPYVNRKRPIFIHADDLRQIKAAVNWANTNRIKMVLCGGRDSWRAPEFLKTNNIPVIYEHTLERPARDTDSHDQPFKTPAQLEEAGVEYDITLGMGRFSASVARDLSHAAAHASRYGLADEDAIRSITLAPAKILGIAHRIGSIEKGKLASMIATDGPLLDIRTNVKRMWIAGQEVSLKSRHTRLYERYRKRPKRN